MGRCGVRIDRSQDARCGRLSKRSELARTERSAVCRPRYGDSPELDPRVRLFFFLRLRTSRSFGIDSGGGVAFERGKPTQKLVLPPLLAIRKPL